MCDTVKTERDGEIKVRAVRSSRARALGRTPGVSVTAGSRRHSWSAPTCRTCCSSELRVHRCGWQSFDGNKPLSGRLIVGAPDERAVSHDGIEIILKSVATTYDINSSGASESERSSPRAARVRRVPARSISHHTDVCVRRRGRDGEAVDAARAGPNQRGAPTDCCATSPLPRATRPPLSAPPGPLPCGCRADPQRQNTARGCTRR